MRVSSLVSLALLSVVASVASCGSGSDDSNSPCVLAGGACVALVPGSCPNGEIGDPSVFACTSGLGVECCMPRGGAIDMAAPTDGGVSGDLPGNACIGGGGQCVALTPTACQNGHIGDSSQFSCGDVLGVACCLPGTNACLRAGGACVAVVPNACAGGQIGDASAFSCGDVIGVQCCLPATLGM